MKASDTYLNKPNPLIWIFYALSDWLIIIVSIIVAINSENIFVFFLASLIVGNRQHALAFLGHDGSHRTASKFHFLNDLLTCVFAFWPIGIGLKGYRRFHFSHHRHVGTSLDPELIHKTWAAPEYSLPLKKNKIFLYLIRDLTGFGLRDVIRLVRLAPPASILDVIGPLTFTVLFWFFSLYSRHPEILGLWYFSLVSSFWATFRLRIWVEHIGTRKTVRVTLAKWMQIIFTPHGAAFHYEHHRWPSIPCWNLPKARDLDRSEPVIALRDLYRIYKSHDSVPSGTLTDSEKILYNKLLTK